MSRYPSRIGLLALALVAAGPTIQAQGLSGNLNITVRDESGRPMAGVRITLKSEKLIGGRTGVTDANGTYRAALLPPGNYNATVVKDGFRSVGVVAVVPLGATVSTDAVLKPLATAGTVVEIIASNSKLDKASVAINENYNNEEMQKLPIANRTLDNVALLTPGTTTNSSGYTIMAGASSYENKFLVNGTDVNDPYFNSSVALYIEDAVDETQVITNGVSPEYGGFMGGVVNAITRRGGNDFSGSFRTTLTNSSWNAYRPLQSRNAVNYLNKVYTATVGGPVIQDKLWFFLAGRYTKAETTNLLPYSGISYTQPSKQKRFEMNLTWQISQEHRLNVDYTNFVQDTTNATSLNAAGVTPDTLRVRHNPYSITALTYDWIINSSFNLNALYSEKKQRFEYKVARLSSNLSDSPIYDADGYLYNNAYFGANPEDRDNKNFKLVLNGVIEAAGTHELKAGYEMFEEINTADNAQSPTGFVIKASGTSFDPSDPGAWRSATFSFGPTASLQDWSKAPGGTFHSKYNSFFLNDNWKLTPKFNMSLGFRYDMWKGDRSAGYNGPNINTLVPRLAMNFDPAGDGVWQLGVTYAQYAGKMNTAITQAGTYVGNPALYLYPYIGKAATSLPGPGATGFNRSDYSSVPSAVQDATLTTKIDPNLKAPLTHEYTANIKHKVGTNGVFTIQYLYRNNTRMFEDYVGDEGTVTIAGQPYSITRWGNTDNRAERTYRALIVAFQDSTDLMSGRFNYNTSLTLSRLYGNYDSDTANAPGGGTSIGNYERAFVNTNTKGYLPTDEPVRLKAFGTWTKNFGKIGSFTGGLNLDFSSGQSFSYAQTMYWMQNTDGYVDIANNANPSRIYGKRGAGRWNPQLLGDLSLQWDGRLGIKNATYFVKGTLINFMNYIQLATWDIRGQADLDPSDTSDENKKLIKNFTARSSSFGNPTSASNYVGNRRVQLELGFKF